MLRVCFAARRSATINENWIPYSHCRNIPRYCEPDNLIVATYFACATSRMMADVLGTWHESLMPSALPLNGLLVCASALTTAALVSPRRRVLPLRAFWHVRVPSVSS